MLLPPRLCCVFLFGRVFLFGFLLVPVLEPSKIAARSCSSAESVLFWVVPESVRWE